MTNAEPDEALTIKPPVSQSRGCTFWIIFILSLLWIWSGGAVSLLINWSLGQTIFEGSLGMQDLRWAVSLGFAIYLLVPLGLIVLTFRKPVTCGYFRLFFALSFLALLMFPARLLKLTDSQGAALIQIAALVIYLAGLLFWTRHKSGQTTSFRRIFTPQGVSLAILTSGLLAIPWIFWGALGSLSDISLGLVLGLLAGLSFALSMQTFVYPSSQENQDLSPGAFLLDGLAASAALAILTASMAQNGNEWVLPPAILLLGWPAVLASRVGQQSRHANLPAVSLLVGLPLSLSLIWVDADELMAVIAMSQGELMGWTGKTVLVSVAVALGLSLLSILVYALWKQVIEQAKPLAWISRAGAVGVAIFGLVAFMLWGQVGLSGERLFVILKDQADVSSAENIQDADQRRDFVYQSLVAHAEETQADLRKTLDRFGIEYRPYYLVNALEINASPLLRLWLNTRKDVDRVLDSPRLRPLPASIPQVMGSNLAPTEPQWNLTLIGADKVWSELGVTGQGILVGNSDTGVQADHPEFADRYRGSNGGDDFNWYDPWFGTTQPQDTNGHGTHTLGTILGANVGVAPGASWIGCVNLARNLGNPALYLDCLQFMLAPFPQVGDPFMDGNPSLGANVLNNSWGCPWVEGCDPQVLQPAVSALRHAGIFVVASTGNSGYSGCGSVQDPIAIYDEVFSVGAVDSRSERAAFSSIGPVEVDGSQRTKPDISAPGEGILSAFPGSSYSFSSGTSMAGPHIVGVVALMWSANPNLIGDIDRTEQILRKTVIPYQGSLPSCLTGQDTANAVGAGIVDAYAAVKAAMENQ